MGTFHYEVGRNEGTHTLQVRFKACTREPARWKEEVYAAARAIANQAKKPIWVCSSGGIGSEVVCRAFYDQGIHFSVLTLEHQAGTNLHDTGYAREWCRKHGVRQKMVTVDMPTFLTTDVNAYSRRYVAIHPFRYFQIKLMEIVEEMGGYAVLGGGEQMYIADRVKPIVTREDLFLLFSIGNTAPLEWCKDAQAAHEPYFFQSTPELCLSYLRLPLIAFVLDNPETVFRHKDNVYGLKRLMYHAAWTDMTARCRYSGLEYIAPLVEGAVARMERTFGSKLVRYQLPVTLFERQLIGASKNEDLAVS